MNRRTNRSNQSRLAASMTALAAVAADCHHASRRLVELQLRGRRTS